MRRVRSPAAIASNTRTPCCTGLLIDVIVSNAAHVLAGVKTADCVPILLGDPVTGGFAAVHAGWRGTLASAVLVGVQRLNEEYGARPEDLCVAIGGMLGGLFNALIAPIVFKTIVEY